eukprot:5062341-Amphidinium_carterae.2
MQRIEVASSKKGRRSSVQYHILLYRKAMPDATAMQGPSSRRSIGDGRAVGMLVDWQAPRKSHSI